MGALESLEKSSFVVTENRIQKWEDQGQHLADTVSHLVKDLEKSENRIQKIEDKLNALQLEVSKALAATEARLKTQTWYCRFMISTLIPANVALLYKVFWG